MSEIRFPLPDVGEGLTEAEIVQWRVAPGDRIALDQVFVEIETAKSLVELPSAFEGTIAELLVEEGQTVDVGTPILVIRTDAARGISAEPAPSAPAADAVPALAVESEGAGAVLVGHGSSGPTRSRRRRHPSPGGAHEHLVPPSPTDVPATSASAAAAPAGGASVGIGEPARPAERADDGMPVIAKPPIRKLAKDLGVDLSRVTPTGPIGDVTRDDVIREASQASVFRNIQTPELPADRETRIPVKGVRKVIAQTMVQSAYSAPHVSVFVDVDATRTMEYIKRLKASPDFAGVKVSPLLIMAKAMIWAARRNPTANAQWTDEEIIVKHYVNLGIAAATPRGLIVPNVKEAQAMSMVELATALEQLTLTAREGKTQPAEMQGGTITITNIGVFGMDTGTPILNTGEVAIVALGTIKQKPWVVDGEVRPRYVTTIGGSFDHRVVDGDVASRFLADVASIIEEPALLLD
ncbi:pyruvate dehydrogenase E2 component (dihydrolipoamide acetyltransferase) [Agromyces flavus]|uniref:Dihydrolipoamide acetyltransferase component of pyruvate dehydrogenase complex n=1 Tax=Agromyces flavus TaxID=589382 RepID=A0A1H1YZK0_9MICO|nr:dihydrolipoamide acetyltransferase family protein [Agromyces flavus]MCP2366869.1 pyruvate dehydrogenase E2 component (dihydrolipoamide acetyltransferase) [Agromyces flavus]GGI46858.1 dihydrolipoamide acetyltransferase component of pyruvate dehydrogenase complex [Agromyces flavus]SDT26985.1 pyruvate dehydrogenase E2 component (dihydrolipoamide acetyltransferase) [Agromyces flavus]